jgi:hypothetical protein
MHFGHSLVVLSPLRGQLEFRFRPIRSVVFCALLDIGEGFAARAASVWFRPGRNGPD